MAPKWQQMYLRYVGPKSGIALCHPPGHSRQPSCWPSMRPLVATQDMDINRYSDCCTTMYQDTIVDRSLAHISSWFQLTLQMTIASLSQSKWHHGPKTPTYAQATARHWALAQSLMVPKPWTTQTQVQEDYELRHCPWIQFSSGRYRLQLRSPKFVWSQRKIGTQRTKMASDISWALHSLW